MNRILRQQTGFTLLELMIVVGIIGILAAIAIPQYEDYVIRAQVTEGIHIASNMEKKVRTYYQTTGHLPQNLSQKKSAGLGGNTGVGAITINQGKYVKISYYYDKPRHGIEIQFWGQNVNQHILGGALYFVPHTKNSGRLMFTCKTAKKGYYRIPYRYLPNTCRHTITF